MGIPKHTKNSARTKSCVKYKSEGRHIINKQKKAAKIVAGKKIKSRKTPKTIWMKWDRLIRNTVKSEPYCDSNGNVYWGVEKDGGKEKVQAMKKVRKGKKQKVEKQTA